MPAAQFHVLLEQVTSADRQDKKNNPQNVHLSRPQVAMTPLHLHGILPV